jgi:hypothetical protein
MLHPHLRANVDVARAAVVESCAWILVLAVLGLVVLEKCNSHIIPKLLA